MMIAPRIRRPLGTMIVYGFPGGDARIDLAIARRIGVEVVEILPNWKTYPAPSTIRSMVADMGLTIHSAHGCWGGRSIRAYRVDLGSLDRPTWLASVDDLKSCVDWLEQAGGRCLVVHPGGLSDPEDSAARSEALVAGLLAIADHAKGTGVVVCVENMPPGVHPGSRMEDLRKLLDAMDRPEIALALDTGHAHISVDASTETLAAGDRLRTTHVHDNDGRQDVHLPPGLGSIDWGSWVAALDSIGYEGPVLLECIRHLREHPEIIDEAFFDRLRRLTGSGR